MNIKHKQNTYHKNGESFTQVVSHAIVGDKVKATRTVIVHGLLNSEFSMAQVIKSVKARHTAVLQRDSK